MAQLPHNLDENVTEYFEFVVLGHKYKFKHLTTEELEELTRIDKDPQNDTKLKDFLYKFISKTEDTSPEFSEVAKKMLVPHWTKFKEMIKAEFGA
jgi:hypothetical protein